MQIINGFLLIVNNAIGKLFTLMEGLVMKRIVFYCGVETTSGDVYVRNAPEYLAMENSERLAVLTGFIAELSQEVEFVAEQISNQGTALEGQGLPQ